MSSLKEIASALDVARRDLAALGVTDALGEVNWTYDADGKHMEAVTPAGAIVMGFNAGGGGTGSEVRWKNKCRKLTEGFSDNFVLAELVLISSHDIGELRKRGHNLPALIKSCAPVNQAVIAYHQPKLIIQTGFNHLDEVAAVYGLDFVEPAPRPAHPTHTLLKHYRMPDGRPWLSIKHPSSMGFSNQDVKAIRSYVSARCGLAAA
jgi:hypothetical protein